MGDDPQLYIIELGHSRSLNRGSIFLLVCADDSCVFRPVMRSNSILAVSRFDRVQELLDHAAPEYRSIGPLPTELDASYFAIDAIAAVRSYDDDADVDVVNFINLYLDLAIAIEQSLPPKYKKALWDLADHMTFTSSVADFFIEGRSRTTYVNAMIWLYGAVDIKIDLL